MEELTVTLTLFSNVIMAMSCFFGETWLLSLSHQHGRSLACGEAEDSQTEDQEVHPAQINQ